MLTTECLPEGFVLSSEEREDLTPESEALMVRIRRAAAMGRAARSKLLRTLDEIEAERIRHGAGG